MKLAASFILTGAAALEPFASLRGTANRTELSKAEFVTAKHFGVGKDSITDVGCSYVSTCTAGGVEGVCVSISDGCCTGGTTTSGLCSGSSDILCCTSPPCTTPSGTGTCEATSACPGTSYSGYCSGPTDIQCCVEESSDDHFFGSDDDDDASPTGAMTGVDVSDAVSTSTASCFLSSGVSLIIPRAFHSTGTVDTSACTTLDNSKDVGISVRDVYMFPCPTCSSSAENQVTTMVEYLSSTCSSSWSGKIWLDIEGSQYWLGSTSLNQAWYESLVDACAASGKACGVYASSSQWSELFGSTTYSYKAGVYDLWYAHYDNNPSFSDFTAFGGWTSPTIKQYQGDTTLCSFGVDENYAEF